MRTFTRYLIRETLGPFFFGVTAFTALQAGILLVALAKRPLLSGTTVLRLTALELPRHLSLALPMGVLLGTLLALGRLSSHAEIVAMRAGGLSGLQLLAPFLFIGLLASLADLYLAERVAPLWHRAYRREEARAEGREVQGVLYREVLPPEFERDGRLRRLIYVGRFDLTNLRLNDVYIHEYEGGREKVSVYAEEMLWDGHLWQFRRGEIKFFHPDGSTARLLVRDGKTSYRPLLPKPKVISAAATDPDEMTWWEFKEFIARRATIGAEIRRFQVDLQTRLALPFACFALTLIGVPLGVQPRRAASAMGFGLAIIVLFVYFFLLSFGQVLGRSGVLPPVLAAWLANLVLCGVGLYLFRRRSR
ncbi:MAG: YjgP/YjgQ family permease [Firmicutes bacterium]|nr:YjgP/YjgQ family permease [Bacillota bacterium]